MDNDLHYKNQEKKFSYEKFKDGCRQSLDVWALILRVLSNILENKK